LVAEEGVKPPDPRIVIPVLVNLRTATSHHYALIETIRTAETELELIMAESEPSKKTLAKQMQ
jgi:hypothetical protein